MSNPGMQMRASHGHVSSNDAQSKSHKCLFLSPRKTGRIGFWRSVPMRTRSPTASKVSSRLNEKKKVRLLSSRTDVVLGGETADLPIKGASDGAIGKRRPGAGLLSLFWAPDAGPCPRLSSSSTGQSSASRPHRFERARYRRAYSVQQVLVQPRRLATSLQGVVLRTDEHARQDLLQVLVLI